MYLLNSNKIVGLSLLVLAVQERLWVFQSRIAQDSEMKRCVMRIMTAVNCCDQPVFDCFFTGAGLCVEGWRA